LSTPTHWGSLQHSPKPSSWIEEGSQNSVQGREKVDGKGGRKDRGIDEKEGGKKGKGTNGKGKEGTEGE